MSQPYFIDSHCHLDFKDYDGDIAPVIARAQSQGVQKFLNICTTLDEADTIVATAQNNPDVYASVGIHPHEAEDTLNRVTPGDMHAWLVKHSQSDKVIALGETGLDYYYDNSPRDLQQQLFQIHMNVAVETGLPLIIHTRSANEDTIALLKAHQGKIRGVIHCFSETQWLADQALALGFYISVSGIATFPKSQEIRDILKTVPLDRLLVETDAPFLAPPPYRGKRNEPAYMIETAKVLADLKGVSLDQLAQATTENFYTLFDKSVRTA